MFFLKSKLLGFFNSMSYVSIRYFVLKLSFVYTLPSASEVTYIKSSTVAKGTGLIR